jgi:uncharacterized membrane protein YqjE
MSGPVISGPGEDPRSLRELVGGVADDAQNLVRGEIALARVEIGEKLTSAMTGLIWVIAGLLFGFSALVILMIAAAAALTLVMPAWAASLIVAAIAIVIGLIAVRTGMGLLSIDHLTPTRTTHSVSKDAQMMKGHVP